MVEFCKDFNTPEVQMLLKQGIEQNFVEKQAKQVKCQCRWGTMGNPGCDCIEGNCDRQYSYCGWFWMQECTGNCGVIAPGNGGSGNGPQEEQPY